MRTKYEPYTITDRGFNFTVSREALEDASRRSRSYFDLAVCNMITTNALRGMRCICAQLPKKRAEQ
jgi:hypothetical protein